MAKREIETTERKTSYMLLGIVFVVGLILGLLFGGNSNSPFYNAGMMTNTPSTSQSSSKVSDLRAQTRSLLQEHTVLAGQYIEKLLKNEDAQAVKVGLDKNTNLIADSIGKVYGNDAKTQFVEAWNMHIQGYENYAKAAQNGDNAGKTDARNKLNDMANNMQDMINKLNGNDNSTKFADLMKEHVAGTLNLIDALVANDTAKVIDLEHLGHDQAGKFADYITQVIVDNKPEMFK